MKELLKKLIKAPSTCDVGELAVATVLSDFFQKNGIDCTVDTWDDALSKRANCIAHYKTDATKPALIFAAHLDVVPPGDSPWRTDPFDPVETDGKIFGRGAADMKGPMAAAAAAVVDCIKAGNLKGDIIFAATAGEETDSCGIKRFVSDFSRANTPIAGIIVTEPTDFDIVIAHRGMLWLEITTTGRTAHSSMPHLGINAISSMTKLIDRLADFKMDCTAHPLLGVPSMSVNQIKGGKAPNVVPDKCSMTIDIRTVPGQSNEAIIIAIENICADLSDKDHDFTAEIKPFRTVDALQGKENDEFIQATCRATAIAKTSAVGYTTDGPFMTSLGAQLIIFGPGKSSVCHKPDEYIEVADIEKGRKYYRSIITELLT